MKKVFFGVPVMEKTHSFFVSSLLALRTLDTVSHIQLKSSDGVVRARNEICADFLKTDCTHLLFADSDMVFSAEHVDRITSHNVDLVGALYPLQKNELIWCLNDFKEPRPTNAAGLREVRMIGTGFLCIRRNVLETMAPRVDFYQADHAEYRIEREFFKYQVQYDDETGRRRWFSEDWQFCQRWREMQGKVFADTCVVLQHGGTALYPLPHQVAWIRKNGII